VATDTVVIRAELGTCCQGRITRWCCPRGKLRLIRKVCIPYQSRKLDRIGHFPYQFELGEARDYWCLPLGTRSAGIFLLIAAQTASFAALTGRALTILRAGLALNTVGSFVNGLMPARSFVAGFLMTTNFAKPGSRNTPLFLSSL
jgi:hypothetical protein